MSTGTTRRATLVVKLNGDNGATLSLLAPVGLDSGDVLNISLMLEKSCKTYHDFCEKLADLGFEPVDQVTANLHFDDFVLQDVQMPR